MINEERKAVDGQYNKLRSDLGKAEKNGAIAGGIFGALLGSGLGACVWSTSHTAFYYYILALIVGLVIFAIKTRG